MRVTPSRLSRVFIVTLPLLVGIAPTRAAETQVDVRAPIVLEVKRVASGLLLQLTPERDKDQPLLARLGSLLRERGDAYPVVILVDDGAKISDIHEAEGYVAKAGYSSARTFVVSNQRGFMAELEFCAAIPTTKTPAPSVAHCGPD